MRFLFLCLPFFSPSSKTRHLTVGVNVARSSSVNKTLIFRLYYFVTILVLSKLRLSSFFFGCCSLVQLPFYCCVCPSLSFFTSRPHRDQVVCCCTSSSSYICVSAYANQQGALQLEPQKESGRIEESRGSADTHIHIHIHRFGARFR